MTQKVLPALLCASVLATTSSAKAFPLYARLAAEAYGKRFNCELCHGYGGGTERTPYGELWHNRGSSLESFKRIETLDADKDGATNRTEIDAGSNPGDAKSTPADPGRYGTRIGKTFVPTEQLELIFGAVDRVEAADATLDQRQRTAVEAAVGRPLSASERLPMLYFAVRNGKRDAIGIFVHAAGAKTEYVVLVGISAKGVIEKLALFHGEPKGGTTVRAYLDCFVGRDRSAFSAGEALSCPAAKNAGVPAVDLTAITSSVAAGLWTSATLLGKD